MRIMKRIVIVAVVIAVLFGAAALLRNRSGGGAPGALRTESFATWDVFLAEGMAPRRKVVFIGLDGAAWNLIDPMIDNGILPTFERLKQQGSWGVLNSVEAYISPPAWTTMMTGYLPQHTGIYNFGHWNAKDRTFDRLASDDVAVPSIWDVASAGGRRTAVVNVPVTYPVREVNGIMVSGLLTPIVLDERRAFSMTFSPYEWTDDSPELPRSFSPVLKSTLDHLGNRFEFFLCDVNDDYKDVYNVVYLRHTPWPLRPGERASSALVRMMEYSPWLDINYNVDEDRREAWCRIGVVPTKDPSRYVARFSHVLFSARDTDVNFASPSAVVDDIVGRFGRYFPSTYLDREIVPGFTEEATAYASFFYDYDDWDLFLYVFTQTDNILHADGDSPVTKQVYRTIDTFLGELIDRLPDDCTLVIASDHGFTDYIYKIDLNRLLEGMGLLSYAENREVDYDRTLVFHNLWCLYFNEDLLTRDELERRGVDCPPGLSPHAALVEHLRAGVPAYLARKHNVSLPIELHSVPTGAAGSPPDLIVKGTYDDYVIEHWNFGKPRDFVITPLERSDRWFHTREGIYVVYGRGVRQGFDAGPADIQDITPTMLYRLGLPLAGDMDGRVMAGVFEPPEITGQPAYVVEDYRSVPRTALATEAQRDSLRKQLRSLGYIR